MPRPTPHVGNCFVVGFAVGLIVGRGVGLAVGLTVGLTVGSAVGLTVGGVSELPSGTHESQASSPSYV